MKPEKSTLVWKILSRDRKSYMTKDEKYIIDYPKNHVINSIEKSLGIFCFDSFENAHKYSMGGELIIRVLGVGKPIKPEWIGWEYKLSELYLTVEIQDFLKEYFSLSNFLRSCIEGGIYFPQIHRPKGTICFKRIITLD